MNAASGFQVLAVCSGNVCRSPFVELLLRERLSGRPGITVGSAGTIARPGMHMTDEMVAVAGRYGVRHADARQHVSVRLEEPVVEASDLVLGLSREHRAAAVALHPRAMRRAFTLTELARIVASFGPAEIERLTPAQFVAEASARRALVLPEQPEADDIADPIGLSQEVYDAVGVEIAAAVDVIARALEATAAQVEPRHLAEAHDAPAPDLSFSFRRLGNA